MKDIGEYIRFMYEVLSLNPDHCMDNGVEKAWRRGLANPISSLACSFRHRLWTKRQKKGCFGGRGVGWVGICMMENLFLFLKKCSEPAFTSILPPLRCHCACIQMFGTLFCYLLLDSMDIFSDNRNLLFRRGYLASLNKIYKSK